MKKSYQITGRGDSRKLAEFLSNEGQFLPRLELIRVVSREEMAFVMERFNHRLRKTLAFKPPHDIFI